MGSIGLKSLGFKGPYAQAKLKIKQVESMIKMVEALLVVVWG